MKQITVREHARLTTTAVAESMDAAQISDTAFEWLCRLNAKTVPGGATLLQVVDRQWLKLDNYVGVVETPCGTRIEILPKHVDRPDQKNWARGLLRKMLTAALDLPSREADVANIELFDSPLTEWVMRRFLTALNHIVQRGIRFDYQRIEEEARFLRGQLDVGRQVRQRPGHEHFFHIRHDVFLPDRPENRLLKAALDAVCRQTREPENWRLSHELAQLLNEIPASRNVPADFRAWRVDRTMAHYQPIKPWCQLVLGEQIPLSLQGDWHGMSLLFPMEKLFERYVEASLRRVLVPGATLTEQAASLYLCVHQERQIFQMKPDMLFKHGVQTWVMDAKWKRVDGGNRIEKYGLKQADFYQLAAYGQKYMGGHGAMALIYPRTADLDQALPVFRFSDQLELWVVPFDLDGEELVLPNGGPQWPLVAKVVGMSPAGETEFAAREARATITGNSAHCP